MINTSNEESREHSVTLANILEAARFLFDIAGITGNQLVLALDKVFTHYAGYSALEAAGIDIVHPEETADTADEDDDYYADYYADGERVLLWKPEIIPIIKNYLDSLSEEERRRLYDE